MTENKMNMPTNATNPNSTTPDITEAECHENLWKLMRLGSTIDYDQVINDPDLIEQYVEQITSMLYDGRATGRSFEELFPQMWLNSYRETDESYHEPRQRALPGLWPSEQAPHNWQMFDFYPRKSKEGYLPLPTFSAAAQVFFVRNQLLPLAMGTLRGVPASLRLRNGLRLLYGGAEQLHVPAHRGVPPDSGQYPARRLRDVAVS